MSRTDLARRAALVVAGVPLTLALVSSPAAAQRRQPVSAQAADQPPAQPTTPAGAVDRRLPPGQPGQPGHQPLPTYGRPQHPNRSRFQHAPGQVPSTVYYVPNGYPYYPSAGGVYDASGRPLWTYDTPAPAPAPNDFPTGITPDLSGSPYTVIDGGVMLVELGYGDRRAFPSCAAVAAERTPDGKPRTLFYRPPADGLVLRPGQRGQVVGNPPVGAQACYTTNSFGRVVLDF